MAKNEKPSHTPQILKGTIKLTIQNCSNLGNADGIGSGQSDPYAFVTIDGKVVGRTKTIKDSLNPYWNEDITFEVDGEFKKLRIRIFDEDPGNKDDKIGKYYVNLQNLASGHLHVENANLLKAHKGANSTITFNATYSGGNAQPVVHNTAPVVHTAVPTTAPVHPTVKDHLGHGEVLHQGELIRTKVNHYNLIMQADGNLVLYAGPGSTTALWHTHTNGKGVGPFRAIMQADGNFVVYDSHNTPTWNSATHGKGTGPYRLLIQEDRNLVVYDSHNHATWATMTNI